MKESTDRFVLVVNKCAVSILDNVSGENLLLFYVDFEDNEDVASYLAYELEDTVCALNAQDKELQKNGRELKKLRSIIGQL